MNQLGFGEKRRDSGSETGEKRVIVESRGYATHSAPISVARRPLDRRCRETFRHGCFESRGYMFTFSDSCAKLYRQTQMRGYIPLLATGVLNCTVRHKCVAIDPFLPTAFAASDLCANKLYVTRYSMNYTIPKDLALIKFCCCHLLLSSVSLMALCGVRNSLDSNATYKSKGESN
ncbi:hypothetical protein ACFE04_001741 [Oxalis oulophora]